MKEQATVFFHIRTEAKDVLTIPKDTIETRVFVVDVDEVKQDGDIITTPEKQRAFQEIELFRAANFLVRNNPELKEKLNLGDHLHIDGCWFIWDSGWVKLPSEIIHHRLQTALPEKEKKEEKGVQMIKKPVWREIQTPVMVPIDYGNIASRDYYPVHLDRLARPVDSLKEMEKITDAQEGDLVKVRSARKMYVCTDVKEVEEPKQKGWWIEVKFEGIDLFPWPSYLDYYFDLTPGRLVRCGDSFFDEDEKIVLDSIEERDRLDGVEDGQYVLVGDRLFMYIDDREVEALVKKGETR